MADKPTYEPANPLNAIGFESAARRILNDLLTIHINEAEMKLREEIQEKLALASGTPPSPEDIDNDPDLRQLPERVRERLERSRSILALLAVPCSQCTSDFNSCVKTPAECCTDYRACLSTCIVDVG